MTVAENSLQGHDFTWAQPVCTKCGLTVQEALMAHVIPPCDPHRRRRHCRGCGKTEGMDDPDSPLCNECWYADGEFMGVFDAGSWM